MEPDAIADLLAAQVEDECPTCGAWVLNPALHADWHRHLRSALVELGERADAYRDTPHSG